MLNEPALFKQIHVDGRSTLDKLLLCLAVDHPTAVAVDRVRELALGAGVPNARRLNISKALSRSGGKAARTTSGWKLTPVGVSHVEAQIGLDAAHPATAASIALSAHVSKISAPEVRAFVEEAVACCQQRLYRAAVVLSWTGAVGVLYDHVVKTSLAQFNAEAQRRFPPQHRSPWRVAQSRDDLAEMKESDFLDVLRAISVLGKSAKQELQAALTLRNGCGHPNSLALAEAKVLAHVETLILNVFSKFA